MSDKKSYIYVLCEPDDETVRYVGRTTNPANRFTCHLNLNYVSQETCARAKWAKSLLEQGRNPVIRIVEVVDVGAKYAEKRWIDHFRSQGCDLLNDRLTRYDSCGDSKKARDERYRRKRGMMSREETFGDLSSRIVDAFRNNPGASQEFVARLLSVSVRTVHRHVKRLRESGWKEGEACGD